MNKKLIAKELLKISKKLIAGPGAGIKVTATDVVGKLIYTGIIKNGKFTLNEHPKVIKKLFIESFDAKGYYDGMRDVNGKKVFSKCYLNKKNLYALEDFINGIVDETIDDYEDGEIEIDVNFSPTNYSGTIGGGYSRSKLKAGNEIEFPVLVEVYTDNGDFDETNEINISGVLSSTGESWYEDIFEADDEDEAYENSMKYR